MYKVTKAKVQKTYHVYIGEDQNYYSVPYTLIGQSVDIKYTIGVVEIFHGSELIASHLRNPRPGHYTTLNEHMPESHQAYKETSGYTKEDFFEKAANIGVNTLKQIEHLINRQAYPQHAYRGCQGLLSLGLPRKYGAVRLEVACELGCKIGKYGMTEIRKILSTGQDLIYIEAKKGEEPGSEPRDSKEKKRGPDDGSNDDNNILRGPEDFKLE